MIDDNATTLFTKYKGDIIRIAWYNRWGLWDTNFSALDRYELFFEFVKVFDSFKNSPEEIKIIEHWLIMNGIELVDNEEENNE